MAKVKKKNQNRGSRSQGPHASDRYDAPPPAPPAADWMDGAFSDDPLGERIEPGDFDLTVNMGGVRVIRCLVLGCESPEGKALQDLVEQMVAARTPDVLSLGGTHAAVRGDGRCLIGAVQHGAAGYTDYASIPRDDRGVPLDVATADEEQRISLQALTRCYCC